MRGLNVYTEISGISRHLAFKEYNHISVRTYPRALFPDSYFAQAGPSEGASRGVVKRDRRAVAAHGCNTHTQRTAAEAASSRRHGWRHRTLWRQCRNSVPNGQALPGSKAVDRNLSHRGSCRGKPQTPRAGRWREGGLAGFIRNFSASLLDLAASRAPSDFFRERIGRMTRMQTHRENDGG